MFHFHKLQLIRRSFATLSITNTTASSQKQILAFQQLLQSTKKNQTTTEEINTFLSKHPTFVDNDSAAALFQALRPQITDSTTPQQISQIVLPATSLSPSVQSGVVSHHCAATLAMMKAARRNLNIL
jgi:hypothetical protein